MKRALILPLIFLFCYETSFALKIRDTGIGVSAGKYPGLCAKLWLDENMAVGLGAGYSSGEGNLHADYLYHYYKVFNIRKRKLPLYAGLSLDTLVGEANVSGQNLYLKPVLGITYIFDKDPLDIFFETLPYRKILAGTEDTSKNYSPQIAFGMRYYFGSKTSGSSILFPKNTANEQEYEIKAAAMEEIPTAIYHLMKGQGASVISVQINNKTAEKAKYKIIYRIGLGNPREYKEVMVGANERLEKNIIPSLTRKDIEKISVLPSPDKIFVEVDRVLNNGEEISVFYESYDIKFMPYDQYTTKMTDAAGKTFDLTETLVSWVAYSDRKLSEIISKASERGAKLTPQVKIVGFQPPDIFTKPARDKRSPEERDKDYLSQIKLIYDTLKDDYNITYVNQPVAYKNSQRVKSPSNTLEKKGNCIELSVLFASLLESIEFDPIIVLSKEDGHAAVGWKVPGENKDSCHLLETNLFGQDFSKVTSKGDKLIKDYNMENEFNTGIPFDEKGIYRNKAGLIILDVKKIRKYVPPSPYGSN
ncbi:MAG: hypothetical protein A2297_02465 [Elusimicrobia bacterium RIFOXYB2_FULL_48_7]|nr:MAG: hypothetical protein A2297_02465 [Elusimicrobia bacterium RIFOXYB2_FULL_48_7]